MVRNKKPVIDTFQKWLDAFVTYMIVLASAYPRRALELIKYQQIVSSAVSKLKGLAWLACDQQFRRRAAHDFSLSCDKVDLELWMVTFAGLAKSHCNVCSSPYHTEDACPSADLNRKPRRPQTLCFDFATAPAVTHMCAAAATPATTLPLLAPSNSQTMSAEPPNPASVARSKVDQINHHQMILVSSPIHIFRPELKLASHPDKNFIFNLLSTLLLAIRDRAQPGSPLISFWQPSILT